MHATWKGTGLLASLVCLIVAAGAEAATVETWVEPELTDCASTPIVIHPETYSFDMSVIDDELDGDSNEGAAEDTDGGDAIFGHIRTAVSNTLAGGIVHVPARGVYRDGTTVTIASSMTIRGSSSSDVVISGDCGTPTPPSAAITVNAGSTDVVVLENLTIRGYDTGIDATGSAGGSTLILRNVHLKDNTIGVRASSEGVRLEIVDSVVEGNSYGAIGPAGGTLVVVDSRFVDNSTVAIGQDSGTWHVSGTVVASNGAGLFMTGGSGSSSITVTDCRIAENAGRGIQMEMTPGVPQLTVHDSEITGNTNEGIRFSGPNTSQFRVTDTLIAGNSGDGLWVENTSGCTAVDGAQIEGIVMDSRIVGNGGDGVDIGGSGSGCELGTTTSRVYCGLLTDTVSTNGGYGLNQRTSGSLYHCRVGENQISYNVSGAESAGTPFCTPGGSTANQVH
jgi:hypothetical protein